MHPLLERADRAIRNSAGTLTPTALAFHLAGQWSGAEILEHLELTFTRTTRGLHRIVEFGAPRTHQVTPAQRVGRFLVLGLGWLPSGRQSPEAVRPRGADAETVLESVLTNLAAMDAALDEAELRFGPRLPLMDHPVLGPLTIHQWRTFHWVHTRHHARQIRARARSARGRVG